MIKTQTAKLNIELYGAKMPAMRKPGKLTNKPNQPNKAYSPSGPACPSDNVVIGIVITSNKNAQNVARNEKRFFIFFRYIFNYLKGTSGNYYSLFPKGSFIR